MNANIGVNISNPAGIGIILCTEVVAVPKAIDSIAEIKLRSAVISEIAIPALIDCYSCFNMVFPSWFL